MSDTPPEEVDTHDDDLPEGDKPKRNWRRELEDRAKGAEDRASRLERELALNKAGLDGLDDVQVQALGAVHDGEMTAEALLATAKRLKFVTEESPKPDDPETAGPQPDSQELERQRQIEAALARMGRIDEANVTQRNTSKNDAEDFAKRMRETKNQAQLRELIRSEGHNYGMVHNWDTQ